jgi:hypothetical protein
VIHFESSRAIAAIEKRIETFAIDLVASLGLGSRDRTLRPTQRALFRLQHQFLGSRTHLSRRALAAETLRIFFT